MCTPQAYAAAKAVGAARANEMTVEGVNLNNLKDAPRKLALTTAVQFRPIGGVPIGPVAPIAPIVARDVTRQTQGVT